MEIGILADTHGLLRPEALEALEGVDRILHAGDVGEVRILTDLEALAPVQAVWGNVDGWDVRERTAEEVEGDLDGVAFAMLHGHQTTQYDRLPERFPGADLVVHGHTHLPKRRRLGSTLLVNPGSAGPRRFGKPVTLARLTLRGDGLEVRHLDLATGGEYAPVET